MPISNFTNLFLSIFLETVYFEYYRFYKLILDLFGNICIFRKLQILQIYSVNRSLPISNITNLFLPFFLILYIFLLCIFRILQVLQIYFSQIFGKYLHIANMTNFWILHFLHIYFRFLPGVNMFQILRIYKFILKVLFTVQEYSRERLVHFKFNWFFELKKKNFFARLQAFRQSYIDKCCYKNYEARMPTSSLS